MILDLSIDWLRANAKKAHFFGLGFIQVKLDDHSRVHFYHPDIPAFVEEPHDHRYDFISTVKRGCLRNRIWKLTPGDDHEVGLVNCQQDHEEAPTTLCRAGVIEFGSFDTHAGSGYHMDMQTFHTVQPLFEHGPVITLVERALPSTTHARTIRRVGTSATCPFSRPLTDDELWQIVRDCIG